MRISDKEKKDIESIIFSFQEWADRYRIKTNHNILCELTGLKKPIIELVMQFQSIDDIKLNIEEYRSAKNYIQEFLNAFEYRDGFQRIPDKDFYKLLKILNSEFPDITQTVLIEKANSILKNKYADLKNNSSKNFNDFVESKYGTDGIDALVELQTNNYLKALEENIIKDRIDILSTERDQLREEMLNGVRLITKNGYEVCQLSSNAKERVQDQINELDNKINELKLSLNNDLSSEDNFSVKSAKIMIKKMENDLNQIKKTATYVPFLTQKNIGSINRKQFQKDRIHQLKADQQQAILQVYYNECTDKNGFLLPDHFGSGIHLIHKKVAASDKASEWTTQDILNTYKEGKPIPIINKYNKAYPVYLILTQHMKAFFERPLKKIGGYEQLTTNTLTLNAAKHIMKKITNAPTDVRHRIYDYLRDESLIGLLHKSANRDYYKMISEFTDIISMKLPVSAAYDYNRGDIYRIVYEICDKSKGKYIFSNELVKDTIWKLQFKPLHWLFMMYIQSYCYKYKEIESLYEFIERECCKETEKELDI